MGGEKFTDIAASSGVSGTDWSWSTLFADYDGDGLKDIFISNGILKRPNDLDYLKFVISDSLHYGLPTSEKLDKEAIDLMPEGKWHNYLFRGKNWETDFMDFPRIVQLSWKFLDFEKINDEIIKPLS